MRAHSGREPRRGAGRARRRGVLSPRRRRRGALAVLAACAAALVAVPAVLGALAPSRRPAEAGRAHVAPAGSGDDWMLVLVNGDHPMEEPCRPELTQLRGGQAVDARCYPDLQRMFDAARAAGLSPKVNSSYRSREQQRRVLDDAIAAGVREGLSRDAARRRALRTVAEPGTSEHETGLAVDVTSESQTYEDNEAVWAWLAEHGWEYGWTLRYPADKTGITGIDGEPWHFRYVGAEAAREMRERGQCLEEYVGVP